MKNFPLDSTDLTWLAGLARALLGEPHAADDLVQETAMAAMAGPMPVGAPRRAWLGSVARRLAARRHRTEARRAQREKHVAVPEGLPDSAELVEKAEVAEQVTAAARRLPEPFRRAILLRFLEGRSPEDIAREEGKPADTVRWRIRRGLELLRQELVRKHDRDWSSWSVLLIPLARSHGDVGLATAGAAGVSSGMVASMMTMTTTATMGLTVAMVMGAAGLWLIWSHEGEEPLVDGRAVVASPATEQERGSAAMAATTPMRSVATTPTPVTVAESESESEGVAGDFRGQVVDEDGAPVAGATVYLVPSAAVASTRRSIVRAQTQSDGRGGFWIARSEWSPEEGELEESHDLGVVANGFRRKVVPGVLPASSGERFVLVVERGRTLTARVVDETGLPVPGLELLVCNNNVGVGHVSPSQRRLRSQRNVMAGVSSDYEQCRGTTGGRGEVVFTGLPEGGLQVLSLDPGWAIVDAGRLDETGTYVEWTAARRLGVKLVVVDKSTGRPVERASATFLMKLTFADGEERDFGQWVGRGQGGVSFVLGAEVLPGLEERVITRAAFYGTARAKDAEEVKWVADAIEDPVRALGVVEVQVAVDPTPVLQVASEESDSPEEVEPATLELDVRYADGTPFEGGLNVDWMSSARPSLNDDSFAEAVGVGRYRVQVPAGKLKIAVNDRGSAGSYPPWSGEVECYPTRTTLVFATLPRGAAAKIIRPEGWSGEWFVHASWRPRGEEEWRGSWGYSTAESSMTLDVLRPEEWRFQLRRDSALEPDPVVRTVTLTEGKATVVDR